MPQFDVHRNVGRNRTEVPYVVVVQSNRLDGLPTRVVVPLVLPRPPYRREQRLAPTLTVEGREVVVHAWEIQTVPQSLLGPLAASLTDDASADAIIGALDQVVSRAYR